jgi:hypothetical protein
MTCKQSKEFVQNVLNLFSGDKKFHGIKKSAASFPTFRRFRKAKNEAAPLIFCSELHVVDW